VIEVIRGLRRDGMSRECAGSLMRPKKCAMAFRIDGEGEGQRQMGGRVARLEVRSGGELTLEPEGPGGRCNLGAVLPLQDGSALEDFLSLIDDEAARRRRQQPMDPVPSL
jgi:hypothetical protein